MTNNELRDLLSELSLQEKIDQLLQISGAYYYNDQNVILTGPCEDSGVKIEDARRAGSIINATSAGFAKTIQSTHMKTCSKNIPLIFMADVINGYKTILPAPIAQACSFDPSLVEAGASVAAAEASAAGVMVTFSPMVDLVNDSRWGRVMESAGEDPYLSCVMAKAMVEGYQGEDCSKPGRIASCVKHFAGYGAPMGGRDYDNCELSPHTLIEDYLPSYRAAVDAGCEMVMTSYNLLNRVPTTSSKALIKDTLRKSWDFSGVVISDWASIAEMVTHGLCAHEKEAAFAAFRAGVDIDMGTSCYSNYLAELVESGKITEESIDSAVLRVLELKNKLGLFENPYKDMDELTEQKLFLCDEHRKIARNLAIESFVLLKNEDAILPLKKDQRVVHAGPFLDSQDLCSSWSLFAQKDTTISVKQGIENNTGISGYMLCAGEEFNQDFFDSVSSAEKVVLYIGEPSSMSGESRSRAMLSLPDSHMQLLRDVYKLNKSIITVVFGGRPLEIQEITEKSKAVIYAWLPGTEGGNALTEVLYGDAVPSGKLSMSIPRCVGQMPLSYRRCSTGRPYNGSAYCNGYIDVLPTPLFPFGYGLSYTTFSYGPVSLSEDTVRPGMPVNAQCVIKNTGFLRGTETVQLYIRDCVASVVRPIKELKGFQRITLDPGEEFTVSFSITEEMLKFYNKDYEFKAENGEFIAFIGDSSDTENKQLFYFNDYGNE